jgi:hypothetical protein
MGYFIHKIVGRTSKNKIYATILKSVVYGCGIWPMTEKDEIMLNMCEMKILMIFGPVIEQGVWKIITNHEMSKRVGRCRLRRLENVENDLSDI